MNDKITVSFFGHRMVDDYITVEAKLYELLRIIMQRGNREIEFLVGRNGEFDKTVASVIRRLKKEINYITKVVNNYKQLQGGYFIVR